MPNLVEIGRGCPEGFAFNWLNTSEIRDFIIESFSSINISFQNIFLSKVPIVEDSLLHRTYCCLLRRFPLRVTSRPNREILAFRILDPANVCCGIRNPRLWNTEYTFQGIRNPCDNWNPESKFLWLKIWNPAPGIRNLRLYWIPLHVAIPQLLLKLLYESTISLA